jgi:hypothetical protein
MKKIIYVILLMMFSGKIYANNEQESLLGLYSWREVVMMIPCELDGKRITETDGQIIMDKISSLVGQKFRVLDELDSNYLLIQILDYPGPTDDEQNKTNGEEKSGYGNFFLYNYDGNLESFKELGTDFRNKRIYGNKQRYFKVKSTQVKAYSRKEQSIGASLTAGVINFPFRLRPQKGIVDFSGAFNFGAAIGYTFRHKSWREVKHSLLTAYSISNVVLDSMSTTRNSDKLTSTNNFTSLSFSLGYMVQYQQVQVGIFLGLDHLSRINQRTYGWIYQSKPWVSLGFGLSIFSITHEPKAKNADETN